VSAPSPAALAGARVAFTVSAGGKPIDSSWQVVSISTWSRVNRVPRAQVVLYDGNPSRSTFPISSAEAFLPGSKVKIEAGYGNGAKTVVFAGEVVRQAIEVGEAGASRLVVEVTDPAIRMTLDRRSAVFSKTKDSTLMETLIRAAGLTPKVTATPVELPEVVQYYASDWDLMVTRAEVNGMVVTAADGTVTVAPPDTGAPPALSVKYGESVLELRAEMDASSQLAPSAIRSLSWDPGTQKVVESGPGSV
jgi:phage protein D